MKFKLSTITLMMGVMSALTTSFADEAPVVDINQRQENAATSTQPEQSSNGSWQVVNGNGNANGNTGGNSNDSSGDKPNAPSAASQNQSDNWQPVSNQPSSNHSNANVSQSDQSGGSVNQRMSRLEQQVANYNQMNLPQQMSDLQQKVAQLQGQLEVEQHALKALTDQQKLYYQDISQQLSQIQQHKKINATDNAATPAPAAVPNTTADTSNKSESEFASKTSRSSSLAVKKSSKKKDPRLDTAQTTPPSADAKAATDKGSATTVAANDDEAADPSDTSAAAKNPVLLGDADSYDRAFKSLSSKNFKAAQTEFQAYLSSYPKGNFAVSAHFWLGEIGLMHEKYDTALKHFQTVVTDYPSSNKVPDAKLKIAMIHAATGKMDVARQEFTQIHKSYPGTTAAQLASIRLQQLANATSVNVQ